MSKERSVKVIKLLTFIRYRKLNVKSWEMCALKEGEANDGDDEEEEGKKTEKWN